MEQRAGRYYSVSRFRRLVTDLLAFADAVPSATIERRMDLSALIEARGNAASSPSWSAIFLKAYATVAARTPVLRTSYLKFPWPRFYEHPINIATLNVDRELAEERIILQVQIPEPETRSLSQLDELIRDYQELPVERIAEYRSADRLSRVPWPFRRWLWWAALNVFGSTRCQHFGTFAFTSVGAQGAGILHLGTLLTSTLHYGTLHSNGELDVRLTFDHRVLDGSTVAVALEELERVLRDDILRECRDLTSGVAEPISEA